jgi:acetolactate synthase-1/3 small subunit
MSTHTLSVLVENSPGVLARVAGLFSRRAYNIDSLAVGPTENPDISRMTIVINVESHSLEQVIRQLDKLVNVIHIAELKLEDSVQAELLLVKISASPKNKFDVEAVLETYGATIVDEDSDSVTIEATGDASYICLRTHGNTTAQTMVKPQTTSSTSTSVSSMMPWKAISHMKKTAPRVDSPMATTGVWNRSLT